MFSQLSCSVLYHSYHALCILYNHSNKQTSTGKTPIIVYDYSTTGDLPTTKIEDSLFRYNEGVLLGFQDGSAVLKNNIFYNNTLPAVSSYNYHVPVFFVHILLIASLFPYFVLNSQIKTRTNTSPIHSSFGRTIMVSHLTWRATSSLDFKLHQNTLMKRPLLRLSGCTR